MVADRNIFASRQFRRLIEGGVTGARTDAELLGRFLARDGEGAELAFAALVERHGPMVLRVARSILRESHDADDAFQAAFLVLARKSGSLRVADSLAPWLHGVTYRVAARIRSAEVRRQARERNVGERLRPPILDRAEDDLGLVLHDEINRLPVRYHAPIVLCLQQGLTQEQAAHVLGWPSGTVRSRLARGRRLLQARLTRRGLTPSALLLGASLAPEAMAAARVESATQAALTYLSGPQSAWVASASVVELTSKVSRSLTMNQFKRVAAWACLAVAAGSAGFRSAAQPQSDAPAGSAQTEPTKGNSAPQHSRTAASDRRQQARDDLAKLQGVWERIDSEFDGLSASRGGAGWTATYEGDQLTLRTAGEHYKRSLVTLDPTTSPKSMNTWDRDGSTKDQTFPGIYEVDGDTMRVCIASPGNPRPTEFRTTRGSRLLLYTYKRIQP